MKMLIVGVGNIETSQGFSNRVRSGGETKLLAMMTYWLGIAKNTIWYLTSYSYGKTLESEGVKPNFILLPSWSDTSVFGSIFTIMKRVFATIFVRIPEKIDVIYCASDLLFDVLPAVFIKIRNPSSKFICCSFLVAVRPKDQKNYSLRALGFYFLQRISFIFMKQYVDLVYVLNNIDRNILVKSGFNSKIVHITSGGFSPEEINEIKKIHKRYDAVFVGRFHPQKGIDKLLKIWKLVIKSNGKARLRIVGGGSQEIVDKMLGEIKTQKLSNSIEVCTNQPRKIIIESLKSAKLLIFPSIYESWGFVVAEGMACGIPVVLFDLPQLKGIFTKGVIKISCFDLESMASQILLLLKNNNLLRRASEDAKNASVQFTWDSVAKKEYREMRNLIK